MRTVAVAVLMCASSLVSVPVAAQLRSQVVVSGLVQPVAFVQDPSNPAVQYIVEQGGRIRVLQAGVLQTSDLLDLSAAIATGGERGLLGLALPRDYATSGRIYVNFTNTDGHTVVARFRRSADNPLVADPGSRFDLMWPSGQRFILQPFANHNGGNLVFGPDGFLYIGMGDGGSGNDPAHMAQDPGSLLGKMLRIDVSVPDGDPRGYRVPPDNPFVDGVPVAALPEIWAFGLRNPWRFSFDDPARGGTGALVIGDVGQGGWEEIDYEPAGRGGRNYGWRNREGAHDNVTVLPPAYAPLHDPVFEYDRTVGQTVTGGFVYRGAVLGPGFVGRYFFADFSAGRVWSLAFAVDTATGEATTTGVVEHTAELGGSAALGLISSLGVDTDGELYVVNWSAGQVLRIAGPAAPPVMYVDAPAPGDLVVQPFAVSGWAIDPAAAAGTGVDVVHLWAYPNPGSSAPPIFVGAAVSNGSRPDVGAAMGSRFANSGFTVAASGLAPGVYELVAFAHSTVTGTFNNSKAVTVTVRSGARMAVDLPGAGASLTQPFAIAGWALDAGAPGGTGVDAIHVWAYPNPGSGAAPIFVGVADYGAQRPDVGAAFGARFTASGYGLVATGLRPGFYQLVVYAHSSVTGTYDNQAVNVTVQSSTEMAVDLPANGALLGAGEAFVVGGWALDLAAAGGTGVDTVHVWAYPATGAAPIFLGAAAYGGIRPDVGAVFGSRFTPSGYNLTVGGLGPGVYDLRVYSHSVTAGAFNNERVARVSVR